MNFRKFSAVIRDLSNRLKYSFDSLSRYLSIDKGTTDGENIALASKTLAKVIKNVSVLRQKESRTLSLVERENAAIKLNNRAVKQNLVGNSGRAKTDLEKAVVLVFAEKYEGSLDFSVKSAVYANLASIYLEQKAFNDLDNLRQLASAS